MTKSRLPDPLSRQVAVQLNKKGLAHLLNTLASHSGVKLPDDNVQNAVNKFFERKAKSKGK